MNDIGVNVAQVLDDLQCGYMNNDEYVRMSRVEEYINAPKQGKFDLTKVTQDQGSDSEGFDAIWGAGIKMNWTLVPVEEQKPHINWRQAIDDDGSNLGRLASWMDANSGMTAAITNAHNNDQKTNVYLENQINMDANVNNIAYNTYIIAGRELAENAIDQARTDYENNAASVKDAIGSGNDIDTLAVLGASIAKGSTDYKAIAEEYRSISTNLNNSNPAIVWTAMGTNTTIMKMYLDGTLEGYVNDNSSSDNNDNSSGDNGSSDNDNSSSDSNNGSSSSSKPKVNTIPEPEIKDYDYSWAKPAEDIGTVTKITIHHTGGVQSSSTDILDTIHNEHLVKDGFDNRGMGYHFIIMADGSIYRGREENALGSHTGGNNTGNLGISLAGNFDTDGPNPGFNEPTQEQLDSLTSLVAYLCNKHSLVPSSDTIWGHYEHYDGRGVWTGCPGNNLGKHIASLIESVAEGKPVGTNSVLWVDFVELVQKGLEKEGTTSTAGLDFFPKICYLYVKLMNDTKNSKFDSDQGWGFPFTDAIINSQTHEKCVFLTGAYMEQRSDHLHEGIDLQTGDNWADKSINVPFCAVKGGIVYTEGQWCSGIYVKHDDGTFSRYLHCRSFSKNNGDRVEKGEQLGIVGGMDNSGSETYDVHLHLEIGNTIEGKTPYERTVADDCGINPVDCFRSANGTDPVSGKPMWTLE